MATGMAMASRRRRAGVECMRHVLRVGITGVSEPAYRRSADVIPWSRTAQPHDGASRQRQIAASPVRAPPRRRPRTGSRAGSRWSPRRSPARSASRRGSSSDTLGRMPRRLLTRAATAGEKRSTTSVGGLVRDDVPGAAAERSRRASPSGSSKVRGVSATSRIRSILKVRSASRVSSQPIRYSACVWSDGSMQVGPDDRLARAVASGA